MKSAEAMDKIFAIGDIHGCAGRLDRLIKEIPIDPERDMLVFIGDYLDRGPDPKGVVDRIIRISETHRKVVCLAGNHERMFLDYAFQGQGEDVFLHNGGMSTLISYGFRRGSRREALCIPDTHKAFYDSLLPFYESQDHIFVHAGLRPGIPLAEQSDFDLVWIREEFIHSDYDFGKTVIFGHTPLSYEYPYSDGRKIGIDTGAVYGGRLTCIELPEVKLYQV